MQDTKYELEAAFPFAALPPTEVIVLDRPSRDPQYRSGWAAVVTVFRTDGSPEAGERVRPLFEVLARMYDFGSRTFGRWRDGGIENMERDFAPLLGTVTLTRLDYRQREWRKAESWAMAHAWPHSVNFGDLCYSSDPTVDLEVTWRFGAMEYASWGR